MIKDENSRLRNVYLRDRLFEIINREFKTRYTLYNLTSKDKHEPLNQLRQLVAYILYYKFNLSYPVIGSLLCRKHTTILRGIKRIHQWLLSNPNEEHRVATWVDEINKELVETLNTSAQSRML